MANDVKFTASNISRFPKGGVIVAENDDVSKGMFILLQGTVGVYKNFKLNDEVQTQVLNQGSFWGEMSLFLGKTYENTFVALSDVIVLVVTKRNVSDFFALQSDMTFTLIEGICKKLDGYSQIIEKQARDNMSQSASKRSSLFPEGHGSYLLPLTHNTEYLYEDKVTCPLCGQIFAGLGIISSRLRLERTDPDMRARYKDIEPLYYEVLSCPNCFFSAARDSFGTVSKKLSDAVNQKVGPYKLNMYVSTGFDRDTFTVFAGYYLAILCASVCFDDYKMITGSHWQKVSRLYQDCNDNDMFIYATREALEDYIFSYQNYNIADRLLPQVCYLIGDLYTRVGELDNARNYFFKAKMNPNISTVLKRQAEVKLETLKEALKGN